MQSFYSYPTFNTESTNKRRKIEIPSIINDDVLPDVDHSITTNIAQVHHDVPTEPFHDIIDLTTPDTPTHHTSPLSFFKIPIKKNETKIINWRLFTGPKQEKKELAQKIRYEKALKLCDNDPDKLLKLYKLLDCKQYVNVGEHDIIYYDPTNSTNFTIKMKNHGEPIKRLFV
jgi:hypothetical protein